MVALLKFGPKLESKRGDEMTIKIRLGALLGPIADATVPGTLAEQARTYAGEGYTSLWSAHGIGRGFMFTDPFITMTVAATVAEEVEIGSAIVQIPLYHPADLAQKVLSLQQICGDRLILGVGAGSTEHDFAALGLDYAGRFKTFSSSVKALRDGYIPGTAANATLSPWAGIDAPPRLFFGTWGNGVARAATEFDGWIASGHYRSVEELSEAAKRYRAAGGGRSIVSTIILDKDTDLGALKERFAAYAEAGFDDAVVMINPGGPKAGAVRSVLD